MKTVILLLILGLCIAASPAGADTCQDNDPKKLCCPQWKMVTSNGGLIFNTSYSALIGERDHTDQLNKKWCGQGDQHFCGITYGPPQCAGTPLNQERYQEIRRGIQEKCASDPLHCHSPKIAHPAETMGGSRN
jgi:hypothetical protein